VDSRAPFKQSFNAAVARPWSRHIFASRAGRDFEILHIGGICIPNARRVAYKLPVAGSGRLDGGGDTAKFARAVTQTFWALPWTPSRLGDLVGYVEKTLLQF